MGSGAQFFGVLLLFSDYLGGQVSSDQLSDKNKNPQTSFSWLLLAWFVKEVLTLTIVSFRDQWVKIKIQTYVLMGKNYKAIVSNKS